MSPLKKPNDCAYSEMRWKDVKDAASSYLTVKLRSRPHSSSDCK